MTPLTLSVIKVFAPAVISFFIGLIITPFLSHFFYRHRLWKQHSRKNNSTTEASDMISEDFKKIHNEKGELSTPRVGGIIIWLSVLLTISLVYVNSIIFGDTLSQKLDFFSKNQTLLPLFALIFASLIGLVDDLLQIKSNGKYIDGISRKYRILVVLGIALVGAWWFAFKLGISGLYVPFVGEIEIGLLFIPFFVITMLGVFSGSVIDGIDGLAGGVMISAFGSYMVIAFINNQIDLAAFSAVIVGGLLAFLWFNIPPARFYMGETGMLGLTVTLSIVAFLTKQPLLLPIIAFPLFITSLSSSIQMFSKKFFNGHKVFKVAPLHHHFEALGWPSYKVTMRFWIVSVVFGFIGIIIAIVG